MYHGIRAYEGSKPFMFISYAHKDSDRIMPILDHLQKEGYRLWFDEGIVPGSEWPENIAQHMNDCAVTVAFISPNSIASPNCRREITYALAKKKPFLSIFLEATEMSPGMELQLSAQQSIMRQNFSSDQLFFEKIASCPDLECCLEKPPVVIPPVMPAVEHSVPADPSAPPPSPKQPEADKKKKKIWIPIVIALVVFGVIGIILDRVDFHAGSGDTGRSTEPSSSTFPSGDSKPTDPTDPTNDPTKPSSDPTEPSNGVTDPTTPTTPEASIELFPDKTVNKTDTSLTLYDRLITVEVAQKINKLVQLADLDLSGCTFESGALDALSLPYLKYVYITNCSGETSYHFLANCSDLRILSITNSGVNDSNLPTFSQENLHKVVFSNNPEFTDVQPLSGLQALDDLHLDGTGITSLSGLPVSKLNILDFSYTAVSDISLLADCSYLWRVYGRSSNVTDISVLASMDTLTVLDFSNCQLEAITTPFFSFDLRQLLFYNCGLTDISGLTHLAEVEVADFGYNRISDFSFLSRSTDTLVEVSVMGNLVTQGDLNFLYDCNDLELLYVSDISLSDLDFCQNMPNLRYLRAANCGLNDISGLANCAKLESVILAQNNISDISPLAGISGYSITMDLAYNNLTDVSALPDVSYQLLCLAYNGKLDLTTLTAKGSVLIVTNVENLADKLANNFYQYAIINCPIDQMAAVQKAYGKYYVTFLTDENAFIDYAKDFDLFYTV